MHHREITALYIEAFMCDSHSAALITTQLVNIMENTKLDNTPDTNKRRTDCLSRKLPHPIRHVRC